MGQRITSKALHNPILTLCQKPASATCQITRNRQLSQSGHFFKPELNYIQSNAAFEYINLTTHRFVF